MSNQTIDGVPLLPCPFCGGEPYGTHDHYVHDDLSPMPCVECRSCSAHLKAEDWNRRVQPSAQAQGEPVAEVVTRLGFPVIEWLGDSLPVGSKLYADQPAPVDWVPTVAQIRYRRPERDCPDFGPWHDLRIEFYDEKRTNYIDMAGWHCKTRLLYLPVTKK